MPGIDRTRVVGKDEEELNEFTCDICLNIFDEPVVTQCCQKHYCKECITLWWEDHTNCPNCREILRTKTARKLRNASLMVRNLLNKLKIKCGNYGTHCQSVLTIEEMANHLKKCNFCDSCKTSQKLLSEKQKQNETLEGEVEKLKKDLGQSKDELSVKQMTIETLKSVNEKLKTDLDQSNNELNKSKTFCSKLKQIEEEAIINAKNVSTALKQNGFTNGFSEEDVSYLTNLAISAITKIILQYFQVDP